VIGEKKENDQNVILQPNPARQSVTIIITGLDNSSALLTMMDMKGQTLFTEEIMPSATSFTKRLDLEPYSSGVYFIKVRTDKNVVTKRLIVNEE
jgi:hypothetical protein